MRLPEGREAPRRRGKEKMEETEARRMRRPTPKGCLTMAERDTLRAVGKSRASKVLGISQSTARFLMEGGGVTLWTLSRVRGRWDELARRASTEEENINEEEG